MNYLMEQLAPYPPCSMDTEWLNHPAVSLFTVAYTDESTVSEEVFQNAVAQFSKSLEDNPVIAVGVARNHTVVSIKPLITLVFKTRVEEPAILRNWWSDPFYRKLVYGPMPVFAVNARYSIDIFSGVLKVFNKTWGKIFQSRTEIPILSRPPQAVTLLNHFVLVEATEKLASNGRPFENLVELEVCPMCGIQHLGAHNYELPQCEYPLCEGRTRHVLEVCGTLQGFCRLCRGVGHVSSSHKKFTVEQMVKAHYKYRAKGILFKHGLDVFAVRKEYDQRFENGNPPGELISLEDGYNHNDPGDLHNIRQRHAQRG